MAAQTSDTPTKPDKSAPAGAPGGAAPSTDPVDAAASLDQQVSNLLAEIESTQQKVEQAMQDPPVEAQVDLAALEAAVLQASAPAEPDLELTDDLVTSSEEPGSSAEAGLEDIVSDLVADSPVRATEQESTTQNEPTTEPTDESSPALDDEHAASDLIGEAEGQQADEGADEEADEDSADAVDELADVESGPQDEVETNLEADESYVDESAGAVDENGDEQFLDEAAQQEAEVEEALANDLNDLLDDLPPNPAGDASVAGEQAAEFFQAEPATQADAAHAQQPAPAASQRPPAVAVPPAGADGALADLDRAIAQTATELIKAEAPVVPVVAATAAPTPAPAAPAPAPASAAAPLVTPAPAKAKAAGSWLWSRIEPKLHDSVALLNKPLEKRPAATRHALGLVGVYTLITAAACWGWAMFLRPDTAASAAIEPFDFQKSGLPAPEHKEAHDDHAGASHEPKDAGGHGSSSGGGGHGEASKDGKKKPLLDAGDGKSVINKTMDERAKKARESAKAGKGEAKKSGGH